MRLEPLRWLSVVVLVAPLVVGVAACRRASERAAPAASPDGAPDFASTDASAWVNGAPTTLASMRGHVVLVEAWHPS